jgi:hypothetical protein
MKLFLLLFMLIVRCFTLQAQIENITEKYDLPDAVSETSGLLFFNGKLITHNDSGDAANLYELDTISGNIIRTINISNATNVDWEDITQDDTYIYIGDFGNNNGDRKDLKIYRILKSDYSNNTSVTSETITFSYEDQTDFASQPNNSNFDAEALSMYKDKLIIFTKNWKDNTVNAYTIPKTIGDHSAKKVSSYTSNGLITGSTYNKGDDSFLLCGYTNPNGSPFLIHIKVSSIVNDDIFSGVIERTDINATLGASQIEGITGISGKKYFLSREKVNTVFNGNPIVLNQKLYRFDNGSFSALSIDKYQLTNLKVFPNPSKEILFIKGIDVKRISIIDSNGKTVLTQKKTSNQILIKELTTGIYFLKIVAKNNTIITKKLIKN